MKINKRQNQEDMLQFQYLAKYSYNKASKYNIGILILTIISVVCLLVGYFWLQIMLSLGITYLNYIKIKNIHLGADAKTYIDRTLFNFDINFTLSKIEKLRDKALKVIEKNQEDYNLKKSHDGSSSIRGVKDWYSVGGKDGIEGVYQCQRENLYWDKKLVKKYGIILISILIISIILFVILNKNLSKEIAELLSIYYIVYSTLGIELFGLMKYAFYSSRIDQTKVICEKIENLEDRKIILLELQEKIEERRKQPYTIPDTVHKINSSKYHKRWKSCKVT